jgi:hypothetical protein
MGVDRTSYLLYGFKFEDKKSMKVINNHYDELMEEPPYENLFNNINSDQTIIFDCMCGDYIYVGVKIFKADEYDDDVSEEISINSLVSKSNMLLEYMKSWPDYLRKLCKDMEPKLYFFIHAH